MDSERLAAVKARFGITPERELEDARRLVAFLRRQLPKAEARLAEAQEKYDEWRRSGG